MTSLIQHFMNGQVVSSASGRQQDVFNPATGAVVAQVVLANLDEVNAVVAAAKAAAPAWAETAPLKRAHYVQVQRTAGSAS
jgi:malonate-semialdehyde dehydrogenase (acetylating)/methylmalonate-semialdehyde dehydrogenase